MGSVPQHWRSLISGLSSGNGGEEDGEMAMADTGETVIISSLALVKMLRHGRAGVPMEVMGLMLGEFIDDYTIKVVDVFSMPQSGNTVSVEAVDPVYQAEMLEMLKRTGRPEMVVGWYHSHPGFGCWLSGTDINTQQSFEQLNSRAVGVVIDPIQSVKGLVVIDCFRLVNPHLLMLSQEPRQVTSNTGHLTKPTITALIHGLNKHYYSLVIDYKKSPLEQKILVGLQNQKWTNALKLSPEDEFESQLEDSLEKMVKLASKLKEEIAQNLEMTDEAFLLHRVGKIHAQRQMDTLADGLLNQTLLQSFSEAVSFSVF